MTSRYYVLVGLDVPGRFGAASPAEAKEYAARLAETLLRSGLAEQDVEATVTGSLGLTEDDVDRVVLALSDDATKLAAGWSQQKDALDRKLAELSVLVDRVVSEREKLS